MVRVRENELPEVFNVGRYLDVVRRTAAGLRFASRLCVFDSELIPTSMVCIRSDAAAAAVGERCGGLAAADAGWEATLALAFERDGERTDARAARSTRPARRAEAALSGRRASASASSCIRPAASPAATTSRCRCVGRPAHARSSPHPAPRSGIARRGRGAPSASTRTSRDGAHARMAAARHDRVRRRARDSATVASTLARRRALIAWDVVCLGRTRRASASRAAAGGSASTSCATMH